MEGAARKIEGIKGSGRGGGVLRLWMSIYIIYMCVCLCLYISTLPTLPYSTFSSPPPFPHLGDARLLEAL
jgi:hypothetical protein